MQVVYLLGHPSNGVGNIKQGREESTSRVHINGQVADWATEAPSCWGPSEKPRGTCLRLVSFSATQDKRLEHQPTNSTLCWWGDWIARGDVRALVLVDLWQ